MSARSMGRFGVALVLSLAAVGGVALAQGAAAELTVPEVVMARNVVDHEPSEPGTSFAHDSGSLVCFLRVENRTRAETAVLVSFESAEGEAASARGGLRLTVPARPRFRTYARTSSNRPAGNYRCVVRSEDGEVLGQAPFTITQ